MFNESDESSIIRVLNWPPLGGAVDEAFLASGQVPSHFIYKNLSFDSIVCEVTSYRTLADSKSVEDPQLSVSHRLQSPSPPNRPNENRNNNNKSENIRRNQLHKIDNRVQP